MGSNNDFRRSVLSCLNFSTEMMEGPTTVTEISNFNSYRLINFATSPCSSIILIVCSILSRWILWRLGSWIFSLSLWGWHFLLLFGIRFSYWWFSSCNIFAWILIFLLLKLWRLLWLFRLEEIVLFVVSTTCSHSETWVVLLAKRYQRNSSALHHILSNPNSNCRISKRLLSLTNIILANQRFLLIFLGIYLFLFSL